MKECSIVIPTFNRSKFLKILLKYISFSKVTCPIIVADGSTDENELDENKKIIFELKKNNFEINHLIDKSFFIRRLYLASNLIKTKYCKINTDDDLFGYEYIESSIKEFSSDKNLSAITGYNVSFHVNKKNPKKSKVVLGEKSSAIEDNIINRFRNSKFNWQPWAVYKTETIKNILQITDDITHNFEIKNSFDEAKLIRFFSFIMKIKSLNDGKYKYINKCMNVTLYHENNWGKKHKIETFDFIFDKEFTSWLTELKKKFNYEQRIDIRLIKLALLNDKHFYNNQVQYKNVLQKISNVSMSKLLEKLNNKINLIRDLEFFLPKDGKKIIKFIKDNL
tara:strand:+ start:639 stop:1646 length:1008 start_codon:yes stop_codon:yes gene_type:complete